jgi:HEPN domain-containing protein
MKRPVKDEATRWLTQAEDEFGDADELRKRGRFYLALFHFQQAAEKAVKAYLHLKTKSTEVLFTHSLDELLKLAAEVDKSMSAVADAKRLDRYYIPTPLEEFHLDTSMIRRKQKKQCCSRRRSSTS